MTVYSYAVHTHGVSVQRENVAHTLNGIHVCMFAYVCMLVSMCVYVYVYICVCNVCRKIFFIQFPS